MPISTIGQNGLNAPVTLTSPVINTVTSASATALTLQSAGTTAITVDTSQNVGIGTASPAKKLESAINAANETTSALRVTNLNTAGYGIGIEFADELSSGRVAARIASTTPATAATGDLYFQTRTASALTEKMRIDSSGTLLVGRTAQTPNTNTGFCVTSSGRTEITRVTGGDALAFYVSASGNNVGTIVTNASSTSYNTSSDYRLKENIAPMTGALSKVSKLKPVTFKWKADGVEDEGFIAHELAEVKPHAVSGDKDAVEIYTDEEGNEQTRIKSQGIDTSFLVATLTAAIQELKTIVDAQAAEIAELKTKVA